MCPHAAVGVSGHREKGGGCGDLAPHVACGVMVFRVGVLGLAWRVVPRSHGVALHYIVMVVHREVLPVPYMCLSKSCKTPSSYTQV